MRFLLIDVTADKLIVATYNDGIITTSFGSGDKGTSSSSIIPQIEGVLAKSNIDKGSLDCIFAVIGPGSFTGIRIGVCTASAMSYGLGIKKCGLSVFEGFDSEGLSVIPSRRGYYFYALDREYGELSEKDLEDKNDFSYRYCNLNKGKFIDDDSYISNLFNVAVKKYLSNNFTSLEPMYLKKSQAERMKEDKK